MKKIAVRLAGLTSVFIAIGLGTASPSMADQWVMPDVQGQILQDAWDAVLAASDGVVRPQTTTSEGPPFEQINLANWEVCSQEPPAGTQVPDDTPPMLVVARPNGCPE